MDTGTVVDKSSNSVFLLTKRWWPGSESNTRHADFQGVTWIARNILASLAVVYVLLLLWVAFLDGVEWLFAKFSPRFATPESRSDG